MLIKMLEIENHDFKNTENIILCINVKKKNKWKTNNIFGGIWENKI